MSNTHVEILGDDELLRSLQALGEAASEVLTPAVLAGAGVVAEAAERKAPRRTDFLSEHIVVEIVEEEDDMVVAAAGPHKDAFWGIFQELGTPHHSAQPFLRPALDENEEKIAQEIGAEAWKALKKVAE
jgi:HK97 gp10 family phage protein